MSDLPRQLAKAFGGFSGFFGGTPQLASASNIRGAGTGRGFSRIWGQANPSAIGGARSGRYAGGAGAEAGLMTAANRAMQQGRMTVKSAKMRLATSTARRAPTVTAAPAAAAAAGSGGSGNTGMTARVLGAQQTGGSVVTAPAAIVQASTTTPRIF